MAYLEIEVRISRNGTVSPTEVDSNDKGPTSTIAAHGIDREVIRLFEKWLSVRRRAWAPNEVRIFGMLLHRFMFGDGAWWHWIERLRCDDTNPVLLKLVFPPDGEYARLASIPWEYLYRPEREGSAGGFVTDNDKTILTRHIRRAEPLPPLPTKDGLHLLVVVSHPNDLGNVLHEDSIAQMNATAAAVGWTVDELHRPTRDSLRTQLKDRPADIIHFIGHGKFDTQEASGQLAFVDGHGDSDWLEDRDVAQILTAASTPQAVILQSCFGASADLSSNFAGVAPQLAQHGIRNVLAMQYAVTNDDATQFSTRLYEALASGSDLPQAVQSARQSLTGPEKSPALRGLPVLYLQSHCSLSSGASG